MVNAKQDIELFESDLRLLLIESVSYHSIIAVANIFKAVDKFEEAVNNNSKIYQNENISIFKTVWDSFHRDYDWYLTLFIKNSKGNFFPLEKCIRNIKLLPERDHMRQTVFNKLPFEFRKCSKCEDEISVDEIDWTSNDEFNHCDIEETETKIKTETETATKIKIKAETETAIKTETLMMDRGC